jgi:Beta-galactosidase jelly roll domain
MRHITVLALLTSGLVACENPADPTRPAETFERGKVVSPGIGPTQVETQTITLVSGNGPIGGRDPENRVSEDGGVTFHDAFILAPDPAYAPPIPGSQWISSRPVFVGPELILYRRTFTLPATFTNPTFTIEVHADNVATIFLNGTQIGQQPFQDIPDNFQGPPETFTAPPGVIHPGTNILAIDVFNFGILTGLDYRATITSEACTLEALAGAVGTLGPDGAAILNKGQENALLRKVAQADKLIGKGKLKGAAGVLNGFIHQVEGFRAAGILDQAQVGQLVDCAEEIRAGL